MTDNSKNKKYDGHKLALILVALVFSIMLWVYVTNQEGKVDEVTYSGVKVVLDGEENMRDSRGLIITSMDTKNMRVTVTGSPRVLSKLTAADISAVIDLSTVTRTGNFSYAPKISY